MNAKNHLINIGPRAASARDLSISDNSTASHLLRAGASRGPETARRAPFGGQERGFTLTELIVVLCLLTIVSVLVLPTLAAGRNSNRDMQCLENQKRLAAGWLMFASENNDTLMNNPNMYGSSPPGVDGDMNWDQSNDTTNTAYLKDSSRMAMAQYIQEARVYKCPADIFKPASWALPRVRSVTLNGALTGYGGSRTGRQGTWPGRASILLRLGRSCSRSGLSRQNPVRSQLARSGTDLPHPGRAPGQHQRLRLHV